MEAERTRPLGHGSASRAVSPPPPPPVFWKLPSRDAESLFSCEKFRPLFAGPDPLLTQLAGWSPRVDHSAAAPSPTFQTVDRAGDPWTVEGHSDQCASSKADERWAMGCPPLSLPAKDDVAER